MAGVSEPHKVVRGKVAGSWRNYVKSVSLGHVHRPTRRQGCFKHV